MSGTADYKKMLSEKLSEVMNDIGVNEQSVSMRRRGMLLSETVMTLIDVHNRYFYIFGSQSEGSTTPGLNSDYDTLYYSRKHNLIQDMSEWESGFEETFLMLQNDINLSPGYCYLQLIRPDLNKPATVNDVNEEMFFKYRTTNNDILVKHTYFQSKITNKDIIIHGPAGTLTLPDGQTEADFVRSFYCKSTLHQVDTWLQKQGKYEWPGKDVLKKCSKSGCFVVAVGSKVSSYPELEWRISTSLQERYLMFSLNNTQLHCYTLMKLVLKTHVNPHVKDVLSSFMCKNVLWYCITDSPLDWHSGTLLSYLHVCLVWLKECIELNNCPHFIIPENNLLAGKMTEEQRRKLLEIMDKILKNDKHMLFQIEIDDLGRRLQIKLGQLLDCSGIPSAKDIANQIILIALLQSYSSQQMLFLNFDEVVDHFEYVQDYLYVLLSNFKTYFTLEEDNDAFPHTDIETLHTACRLLIPVISSTLGSVLASEDIASNQTVSDRAIKYLEEGRHCDVLSGRLKLVSVFYCTGNIDKAFNEFNSMGTLLSNNQLKPCMFLCPCRVRVLWKDIEDVTQASTENMLTCVQSYTVFCTYFLQREINCVPHELRYEILRSYNKEDIQMRTRMDTWWMDNIVVDSLPYFNFLWYKIFGRLNMKREQEQALASLRRKAYEKDFCHTETTLNLLGQCYEQENQPIVALQCYIDSLKHRRRINAATWLLCFLLFKLLKQQNKQ